MATKSKTHTEHQPGPPKKTRQGQGLRSLPSHGRKKLRGQGKG